MIQSSWSDAITPASPLPKASHPRLTKPLAPFPCQVAIQIANEAIMNLWTGVGSAWNLCQCSKPIQALWVRSQWLFHVYFFFVFQIRKCSKGVVSAGWSYMFMLPFCSDLVHNICTCVNFYIYTPRSTVSMFLLRPYIWYLVRPRSL